jgi:hypothetical protein
VSDSAADLQMSALSKDAETMLATSRQSKFDDGQQDATANSSHKQSSRKTSTKQSVFRSIYQIINGALSVYSKP